MRLAVFSDQEDYELILRRIRELKEAKFGYLFVQVAKGKVVKIEKTISEKPDWLDDIDLDKPPRVR